MKTSKMLFLSTTNPNPIGYGLKIFIQLICQIYRQCSISVVEWMEWNWIFIIRLLWLIDLFLYLNGCLLRANFSYSHLDILWFFFFLLNEFRTIISIKNVGQISFSLSRWCVSRRFFCFFIFLSQQPISKIPSEIYCVGRHQAKNI